MKKIVSHDRNKGLLRTRSYGLLSRRQFSMGVAGTVAALAASTLVPRSAAAATDLKYTGWQGYDEGIDVGGWFAQNDINLQPTYITAGNEEIIAAIQAGGKGNMDVVTPAALYMPFYAKVDLVEPLDVSRIPNYSNLYPEFQHMPILESGGKVYGTPLAWGSVPLMYNADIVKEAPTSWREMLNPKWKGKVALVHDLIAVMIPFISVVTGTREPWNINKSQLEETIELLIRIKKEHALTVAPGYGELGTLFANGEIVMAPAWEPTSVWGGADTVNLEWVIPEEGTLVFVDNLSIVKQAPNLDLSYKLLNQSLSIEAQVETANINSTGAVVADALPMLDDLPKSLYPYNDIQGWFDAAGGITNLWPLDADGDRVTFDDVTRAWERFLSA